MKRNHFVSSGLIALVLICSQAIAGQWSGAGRITYVDFWLADIHFKLDGTGTKGNFYNCPGVWAYKLKVTASNKHQVAALMTAFAMRKQVKVYEVGCTDGIPEIMGLNVVE